MGNLANAIGFQATWFAAVIGAGSGRGWIGPLAVVVFAALQLAVSGQRRSDLRLLALAALLGFALDSAFVRGGLLRYASPGPFAGFAPGWIVALWIALALALNHSLGWLRARPALAALLGACAAPLSYLGAARGWHAVAFAPPIADTLLIVALCWAAVLWAMVALARRWQAMPVPGTRMQPA